MKFAHHYPRTGISAAVLLLLGVGVYMRGCTDPPAPTYLVDQKPVFEAQNTPAPLPVPGVEAKKSQVDGITTSGRVDQLLRAGTPESDYAAYKMVQHCVYARRHESQGNPETRGAEQCGDIGPGLIVSRLQWLERAAQAGVHGAYYSFVDEGPTGERALTYDGNENAPPEWLAKVDEYQRIGAAHGDPDSLMALSTRHENDGDLFKAAVYMRAYMQAVPPSARVYQVMERLLDALTPEQRSEIAKNAAASRWKK